MKNTAPETVNITIPSLPFEPSDSFDIDEKLITSVAADCLSLPGLEMSVPYFFLGHLPMWSADELYLEHGDRAHVRAVIGNFMVSGFFGGVWLRDEIQLHVFRGKRLSVLLKGVHRLALRALEQVMGVLINTALEGGDLSVRVLSRMSIEPFLILNGYNWGYFDYIVKNPPRGAEPPGRYRELQKRFLDWQMPDVEIAVLEEYKTVLDLLYGRWGMGGRRRWSEMRAAVSFWKGFSAMTGSLVWHIIMNDSMPGPVYELLLELSARFLLIAELCILPAMKCYAEADIDAGRNALLQQAGMIAWGGSYMLGLTSSQPEGTFPGIDIN